MNNALNKLKAYQARHDFTVRELADVLGVGERIIYYWFDETIGIPLRTEKMIDALIKNEK